MAVITADDVAASLGRPITTREEIAQVNAWIRDAEVITRVTVGDLPTLDQDILKTVLTRAVVRKALNPEGKKDERIDDYSYGLSADVARADVFLTDEEIRWLTPSNSDGAFTIRLAGSPGYAHRPWGW